MRDKKYFLFHALKKLSYFLALPIIIGVIISDSFGQTIKFTDVTRELQARGNLLNDVSCYGHGVIMADISGDSLPDIYISNAVREANGLPEVLYISDAGKPYIENDQARGVSDPYGETGSHGILFVDYDNDGDYDIFNATTDERNRLYRNKGDGFFQDVTDAAGIPKLGLGTRGVVAFDADNDGYMDLYAVNWGPVEDKFGNPTVSPPQPNEFYRNLGTGKFLKDDTRGLSVTNPSNLGTQGVTAMDVDNDGDVDVFVCHRNYSYLGNDENGEPMFGPDWGNPTPNELFINDGTGHFSDEAKTRKLYYEFNDCNGATFADYDNDGDLDAFVVPKQFTQKKIRIYKNDGTGNFSDVSTALYVVQWGFSCILFDADNDGDLDLYALNVSHENSALYINDGAGKFSVASGTGLEKYCNDPRAASVGDIDNDGDLDMYFVDANKLISASYGNYLFRNDTPTTNRWLKVSGRGPKGDMGGFGTKIWVFEHGYMDNMAHLVGYKQVITTYGYLCQDDPMQHFGLGQRDTVDVRIKLLDGTTLTAFHVAAKQKLFFSKPTRLVILDGDQQEGKMGQTLERPLRIRVNNDYGNPVIGVPVVFQVMGGNGQIIEAQPVYTDKQGIAQSHYILGSGLTQQIQASSTQIPGQQVLFTARVTQAIPERMQLVSKATLTGTVGAVIADSIKVQIFNSFGNAHPNHSVKFEIISGGGSLWPGKAATIEQLTNQSGYATAAWELGPVTSVTQEVKISSQFEGTPLTGSPISVTATAMPGSAATLVKMRGDLQTSQVGTVLPEPLAVKVSDPFQNPLAGISVRFQILAGGGSFNLANSITVTSDASGLASAAGWRLGQVAGAENRVRAEIVDNTNLFVNFTATATPGNAAKMLQPEITHYAGVVNRLLPDSLGVKIVDEFNNTIQSYPVDFIVQAGGGLVNGQTSSRILTRASGQARCTWRLGTGAGTDNHILKIEAPGLVGSPTTLYASAQATSAYKIVKVSGDQQSGYPGSTLGQPMVVAISDTFNNSIQGHEVLFSVVSGDANFSGSTTTSTRANENGLAKANLSLGRQVGPVTVRTTGHWQLVPLVGSPVDFSATIIVGSFDPLQSSLTATSPVPANGSDQSALQFYARDSYGNPVSGLMVEFIATGDGNTIVQPSMPTDVNGFAAGYLSSTLAEEKIIWARVNGTVVNSKSVSVLFTGGGAAKITKVSGDLQSGVPGELLPQPLAIQIYDYFNNPVSNVIIYFKVTSGNGKIVPSNVVSTDSLGQAAVQWRLGQKGKQTVQAMVIGIDSLKVNFEAFFSVNRAPEIITFEPLDSLVEVTANQMVHFHLEATDKDEDSLRYEWYLNEVPVGQGQSCDILVLKTFPELSIMKAKVTDSVNRIEKTWYVHLKPISSVETKKIPEDFALEQNYPNPFNPTTVIAFQVPRSAMVILRIYNSSGQVLRELTSSWYPAGIHQLTWDGKDQAGQVVPSGVYYYEMRSGDFRATHKLLLLK